MNYEHAFHVGNHADLLKHGALAAALARLAQKAKPMTAIDLFAGSGRYDLMLDERALRGGEWRSAAAPLWAAREAVGAALDPFLRALDAVNGGDALRVYPGSPALMRAGLREADKLFCVEAKPSEAEALERALGGDKRVRIHQTDGWAALESLTPPTPRRGLVLVDPPYERAGEFDRLTRALERLGARWPVGVAMLWWPETTQTPRDLTRRLIHAAGDRPLLMARLAMPSSPTGLKASAIGIANPPFGFEADLAAILASLETVLAADTRLEWLIAPR